MFKNSVTNKSVRGAKLGESILSIIVLTITIFVVFRIIMPSDILSTGYFYDSAFRAPLGTLPAGTSILGVVFPGPVSGTGLAVGVAMFLGTLVIMYGIATNDKGWIRSKPNASMKEVFFGLIGGKIKVKDVNQELLTDALILFLLIILDTSADAAFLSSGTTGDALTRGLAFAKAFVAALIINTLLSEFLAVKSAGLWLMALGQIKGSLLDDFPSLRRGGRKNTSSQPRTKPKPPPGGPSLPQRSQSKKRQRPPRVPSGPINQPTATSRTRQRPPRTGLGRRSPMSGTHTEPTSSFESAGINVTLPEPSYD